MKAAGTIGRLALVVRCCCVTKSSTSANERFSLPSVPAFPIRLVLVVVVMVEEGNISIVLTSPFWSSNGDCCSLIWLKVDVDAVGNMVVTLLSDSDSGLDSVTLSPLVCNSEEGREDNKTISMGDDLVSTESSEMRLVTSNAILEILEDDAVDEGLVMDVNGFSFLCFNAIDVINLAIGEFDCVLGTSAFEEPCADCVN
jgi:hypothetical protein